MAKSRIEELKNYAYWLSVKYQQKFYEHSSDWNKYLPSEHTYLKNVIGLALYGSPNCEDLKNIEDNGKVCKYVYKEKGAMQLIDTIYGKIVEHSTQLSEEKEVLCSILYTCIYDENALKKCDKERLQEIIYVKPIFKIKKNIKSRNITEYQIWYVDTEARVYKNWTDYLKNNHLPTCVMIAPKDGIYQADLKEVWSESESNVWVQVHSNNKSKKIINAVDTTSTLVNIGCVGIGIVAMFNPISAPIAIAGLIGGAASGVWGGSRSIAELVDRGKHNQSISIINKQAFPAWLGVAGNTLGLAASGGSALLTRAVRTGATVTKGAQIAHDTIQISNLVVNISGVTFNSVSVIQKYKETGEVSPKDLFFLTTHLLLVCNSVVQMRVLSDIVKSNGNSEQLIKDYEMSLCSKRHQKTFRTLVRNMKNTARNIVQGNEEIIRGIKNISNKDDFFAAISCCKKMYNTQRVQLSSMDGKLSVDGIRMISPSSFTSTVTNKSSYVQAIGKIFFQTNTISSNELRLVIEILKNFYVTQSIEASEPTKNILKDYEKVISDLGENPDKTKILESLLEAGLCIVKSIHDSQYAIDYLLSKAVIFLWNYIQTIISSSIPGIKPIVDIFEDQIRELLFKALKYTCNFVKSSLKEWVDSFCSNMELHSEKNKLNNSESESNLSKNSTKDVPVKYNGIVIKDPLEVMSFPKEYLILMFKNTLPVSKISNTSKISKELIKMCEEEFNDFFFKYPTFIKYNFKVTELSNELKGILFNLEKFSKRNIIFYKLIFISVNIFVSIKGNKILIKDRVVSIMKFLWLFVCMNFSMLNSDDADKMSKDYESDIINIIVAINETQTENPHKWSSAFMKFKEIRDLQGLIV